MLGAILILLILLWFLGYIHIPGFVIPDITLFTINGREVTLITLAIFFVIIMALEALPSPLRQIGFVVLVLWLLSTLGIVIAGLASILVLAIILGLILALMGVV